MSYNTPNYTEQGGEKTVIGGTLEFGPDAEIKNFPNIALSVEQLTGSSFTAAEVGAKVNELLQSLVDSGVMAPEE